MTDTANLGLPFIDAAQAQKHVTHNEALRILDTLVQLAVLDRDLATPPGSPSEGQRWIVAASPTGAWAGHARHVAAWQDGAWQFSVPATGWSAYVVDEGILLVWNGTAWGDFFSTVTSIQNLARLGIGTTADSTNPLSAKLNNTLFVAKTVAEGGDGNLRYKLSKESASKTLSFLLQDNFSGRAEIGLTGDDDFHFKVSPDGSTWTEGIKIAAATGKVSFPISGGPREMLQADRTYYVRTDGSDGNNGLTNNSGGAFLTVQKAVNVVFGTLDLGGFNVTIQIADGTYTGGTAATSPQVGAGAVTVKGNAGTPGNVILSTTGTTIAAANGAVLYVQDLELRSNTSGGLLLASRGGVISFQNIRCGTSAGQQIRVDDGGRIVCTGNYAIVGGGLAHWTLVANAILRVQSKTITLSGTPAFSQSFCNPGYCSAAIVNGNTFSGAATGVRYQVDSNAVLLSGGAGAGYLPGDTAGTATNGGQYV